ncbi:GAF domain-containing protein [Streptomyces sp. NBC_00513]|uniref:GAF domain-containing protein n=1 Tax=unclassified Streptomyces TaxID=2593676 RepID=UPI00224E4749|nr:GAF domain-containing protein [Streptomyces sp. NBC_00424]MCX5071641.1 GAF domain-containing protein [Streptomyces sp. NBC_00424]WUD44968.1 GAF domain-containing protein [Streptomyces sp. NBC_00513]
MTRDQQLAEAFVGLGDNLADDVDPLTLLDRLVRNCVALTPVDAAAVMLANVRGRLRAAAVTDDGAEATELFHFHPAQGPCADSFRLGAAVHAPDLDAAAEAWPDVAPLARRAGYRGAHGMPLHVRDQKVGALHLLTRDTTALTESDVALLQAMADVTIKAVATWRANPPRPADVVANTQAALATKAAVDTAAVLLAAAGSLAPHEARQALHTYSVRRGQRAGRVAHALILRDLDPHAVVADTWVV